MILDSLFIPGVGSGHIVSLTQDIRVVENPRKKKDLIEEPDYDLGFFSAPQNQIARALRVIHIGRADLLPYRQDIYDAEGQVVTQAFYSNYRKFGDINFPSTIVIKRPLDQYSLTVTVSKATFNQKLEEDQFKLDIPATGVTIQDMDKPQPEKPKP